MSLQFAIICSSFQSLISRKQLWKINCKWQVPSRSVRLLILEKSSPLFKVYPNRIILTNGKHPHSQSHYFPSLYFSYTQNLYWIWFSSMTPWGTSLGELKENKNNNQKTIIKTEYDLRNNFHNYSETDSKRFGLGTSLLPVRGSKDWQHRGASFLDW